MTLLIITGNLNSCLLQLPGRPQPCQPTTAHENAAFKAVYSLISRPKCRESLLFVSKKTPNNVWRCKARWHSLHICLLTTSSVEWRHLWHLFGDKQTSASTMSTIRLCNVAALLGVTHQNLKRPRHLIERFKCNYENRLGFATSSIPVIFLNFSCLSLAMNETNEALWIKLDGKQALLNLACNYDEYETICHKKTTLSNPTKCLFHYCSRWNVDPFGEVIIGIKISYVSCRFLAVFKRIYVNRFLK